MRRGTPPSMTTSSRKLLPRAIIRDEASGKIIFEGVTTMPIMLLDDSLKVEVFYEETDEAFADNICICFEEDCPPNEKIFIADETNIFLTPEQATQLAAALVTAIAESRVAARER